MVTPRLLLGHRFLPHFLPGLSEEEGERGQTEKQTRAPLCSPFLTAQAPASGPPPLLFAHAHVRTFCDRVVMRVGLFTAGLRGLWGAGCLSLPVVGTLEALAVGSWRAGRGSLSGAPCPAPAHCCAPREGHSKRHVCWGHETPPFPGLASSPGCTSEGGRASSPSGKAVPSSF